jgi:predicted O-methyltransferase YrrM
MNELDHLSPPLALAAIRRETEGLGFAMASDLATGSLLRMLAASKPAGNFLELGTGTGAGTAWILDGMDGASRLVSVDHDAAAMGVARRALGEDARATFVEADAGAWLAGYDGPPFDFVFADTWAGKYTHLDEALRLLERGGLYVIDDLLPQPNWPDGHGAKARALIALLDQRPDLTLAKMSWSTGLIVAAKNG